LSHLESTLKSIEGLEVITGKKNLEIRPKGSNKGALIAHLLASQTSASANQNTSEVASVASLSFSNDFIFTAGDDRTDEDMFRVINQIDAMNQTNGSCYAMTCVVGPFSKKSLARSRVENPHALIGLLDMLG
jgi:trehalose 6-phosphate synthase/phosphatase